MQFLTNTDRNIDLPVSNIPRSRNCYLSFLVLEISFFQKIHQPMPHTQPMSHLYTVALSWGINLLLSNYFLLYWGINFHVFNKQIGALICICLFHTGALLCMCLTLNGGNSVLSGSRTNITDFEIGLKNNRSLGMCNQTI